MTVKKLISKAAFDLGFCSVGVASAEALPELQNFNRWLSQNYSGTMDWLERDPEARCDPGRLLPNAKSVICVALKYGDAGDAKKARFARGADYHKEVRDKLEKLWDVIKRQAPEARVKFCVDTSPVLEKALAVRAGIGWRGKHSIVLNSKTGSHFVLGEIITDLQIEPDKPITDQCGNCARCVDACPTKAIAKPYILNAGRCISYLTIEHKGEIPGEFKKYIEPGQYGCDICQNVCPFNN